MKTNTIIIGIFLVSILVLSGCAQQQASSPNIPSRNCREVQVPYEAQEEYSEQEPYIDTSCEYKDYVYAIENQKVSKEGGMLKLEYDFVNRDNEKFFFKGGATWIINNEVVYFKDYDPETCCNYEVYPGSRVTVTKYFENPSAQQTGRYNVVVPQKQVCEEVTRYRTTTKYRTVTKYRTETQCE